MRNCKNPGWLYNAPKVEDPEFDFRLDGFELVAKCHNIEKRVNLEPVIAEILTKLHPTPKRGRPPKR